MTPEKSDSVPLETVAVNVLFPGSLWQKLTWRLRRRCVDLRGRFDQARTGTAVLIEVCLPPGFRLWTWRHEAVWKLTGWLAKRLDPLDGIYRQRELRARQEGV